MSKMIAITFTRAVWTSILFVTLLVGGCVAVPSNPLLYAYMPIGKETTQINLTQQGIALLSLRFAQSEFKGIPELFEVWVKRFEMGKSSSEPATVFSAEPDYRNKYTDQQKYRDYLVSMQLDPGNYRITVFKIGTHTSKAVKVNGTFGVFGDFRVQSGKTTYVGSMKAVMRKRKCGELRILSVAASNEKIRGLSASAVPFLASIVEGVTSEALGYTTGTFDLEVFNNVDRDLSVLRAEYPILRSLQIEPDNILTIHGLNEEQKSKRCSKENAEPDVVGQAGQ